MMIQLVFLTKLLFCNLSPQPGLTLNIQATSVEKALKQLSIASNVHLTASAQTADDVVSTRLKEVSLTEAMHKIAEAVDGTWVTDGAGYRLTRTLNQVKLERVSELADEEARIKAFLVWSTRDNDKLSPWSSKTAEILIANVGKMIDEFSPPKLLEQEWNDREWEIRRRLPIERAMQDVLRNLDPKVIALLPRNSKTVWSTNPNQLQRSFSRQLQNTIDAFIQAQNQWIDTMNRHDIVHLAEKLGGYEMGIRLPSGPESHVGTVLIDIEKYGVLANIKIELWVYDEEGQLLESEATQFQGDDRYPLKDVKEAAVQQGEKTIATSGDERLIFERGIGFRDALEKPLPKGLMDQVFAPESNEPLAYYLSPALIQVAEIKNVNMVACLTDDIMHSQIFANELPPSADQFLNELESFHHSVSLSDDWIVVKPKMPIESRERRIDRKILGRYLRRLRTGKPLSLDEKAAFAVPLQHKEEDRLETLDAEPNPLVNKMTQICRVRPDIFDDPTMLELYSLLSESQKQSIVNGGLQFAELTENQLNCVKRIVYGPLCELNYTLTPEEATQDAVNISNLHLARFGLLGEPTQSLPLGIPGSGMLKVKVISKQIAWPVSIDSLGAESWGPGCTPEHVAIGKLRIDHPELEKLMPYPKEWNGDAPCFYAGEVFDLTLSFEFTTQLSIFRKLTDYRRDSNTVYFDQLPDAFRRQVWEDYDRAYKSYTDRLRELTKGANVTAKKPPP